MTDVLRELSDAKLPEIDALIDRAQRVRAWLAAAQHCHCQTIDACALFDDSRTEPTGALQPAGRCPVGPRSPP